jgi:hypothetical protein
VQIQCEHGRTKQFLLLELLRIAEEFRGRGPSSGNASTVARAPKAYTDRSNTPRRQSRGRNSPVRVVVQGGVMRWTPKVGQILAVA